jgi:hypothetical protein
MNSTAISWLVVLALGAIVFWRLSSPPRRKRTRNRVGAAGAGAIYDLLNQDKRNALEIVVEDRAAARDPEDRDGNLPELERPKKAK